MRYAYPFTMEPQPEGGFSVSFPDVPEVHTEGDTVGEARERAEDALVTGLSFYTDDARPLPVPSAARVIQVTLRSSADFNRPVTRSGSPGSRLMGA